MAEVEYAATTMLPVEAIWEFVQEMDNWAHHMVGYQSHVKQSPVLSLWTLKGDVGVLTRTLTFEVHVEEWNGPETVRFRLRGVNEPMTGEGVFRMEGAPSAGSPAAPARREGAWVRGTAAVLRFFRRLFGGGAAPRRVEPPAAPGLSRLVFRLELKPGGPMGPMIDAMIKPALLVAAEELSNKIIAEVEARQAAA